MCTPNSIITCSQCGEIYNTTIFSFCPSCSSTEESPKYFKCPECKSTDLQEVLIDDYNEIVHLRCRTCRNQFWKNLPKES